MRNVFFMPGLMALAQSMFAPTPAAQGKSAGIERAMMVRSVGPDFQRFGTSKHSVAQDRRQALKRKAVKRARRLGHA